MPLRLPDVQAAQERNRSNSLSLIGAIGAASARAFAQDLAAKTAAYQAISDAQALQLKATQAGYEFREKQRRFDVAKAAAKAKLAESNKFRAFDDRMATYKAQASALGNRRSRLVDERDKAMSRAATVEEAEAINKRYDSVIKGIDGALVRSASSIPNGYDIDPPYTGDGPSNGLLANDGEMPIEGEGFVPLPINPAIDMAKQGMRAGVSTDVVMKSLSDAGFTDEQVAEAIGRAEQPSDQSSPQDTPKSSPTPNLENLFLDLSRASNDTMLAHQRKKINSHPRMRKARADLMALDRSTADLASNLRKVSSLEDLELIEDQIADAAKEEERKRRKEEEVKNLGGSADVPSLSEERYYREALKSLRDEGLGDEDKRRAEATIETFERQFPEQSKIINPPQGSFSDFSSFGASPPRERQSVDSFFDQ